MSEKLNDDIQRVRFPKQVASAKKKTIEKKFECECSILQEKVQKLQSERVEIKCELKCLH
jgi:hypothetical protein